MVECGCCLDCLMYDMCKDNCDMDCEDCPLNNK